MKSATLGAALLLAAQQCAATHDHRLAHVRYDKRHHGHGHLHLENRSGHVERAAVETREEVEEDPVVKRGGGCSLPDHPDLVAITSNEQNKGFAMSPDQPCTSGNYCPIACKSGMVMAQWKPGTKFVVGESMQGGLLCENGVPKKPIPDSPYCVDGTGTVKAVNKCGKTLSFCQTVLPGNEAMLIPTDVSGTSTLAVPGPSYWAGTSAHYYVNPPGVLSGEGCLWGSEAKAVGNWAAYVAGANTDESGKTFVTLGWNPIYEGSKWGSVTPSYGLRIECNGECNGAPCEIDPSKTGLKAVKSNNGGNGAGGANYCVVTVAKGSSASIVVFNTDGSGGDGGGESSSSSSKEPEPPKSSSTPKSSTPSPSPTSSAPSSTSSSSSATWEAERVPTSTASAPEVRPGIFHENGTSHDGSHSQGPTSSFTSASPTAQENLPTTSTKSDAVNRDKGGAAVAGLIVAIVAAAWLY